MLKSIFDEVKVVDVLDSGDTAHLAMMKRPDLGVTFTKLHCWTLTHYSKCVFMDADTMVRLWLGCYRSNTHFSLLMSALSGAFKYRWAVWQRGAVGCSRPRMAWLLQLRCVCVPPVSGDVHQTAGVLLRTRQLRRWATFNPRPDIKSWLQSQGRGGLS